MSCGIKRMLSWIKIMERRGCYGISPYQGVSVSDKCVEHSEECPVHMCMVSDSQWQSELKVTRLNMCHLRSVAGELFSVKGQICQELKSLEFL